MISAAESETSVTTSDVCLPAARHHQRGRLAAAVAIGVLALVLAAPTAATADPVPEAPAVTGTITVGSDPWGDAVNPVTGTVYVTNSGSGTVSVISGRTHRVTGTITTGVNGPYGVAVNPRTGTVYVTNIDGGTVSVISG